MKNELANPHCQSTCQAISRLICQDCMSVRVFFHPFLFFDDVPVGGHSKQSNCGICGVAAEQEVLKITKRPKKEEIFFFILIVILHKKEAGSWECATVFALDEPRVCWQHPKAERKEPASKLGISKFCHSALIQRVIG